MTVRQPDASYSREDTLYRIDKAACHKYGLDWTDPRAGKTYKVPKKGKKRKVPRRKR
jgi:hypothetical protein